jgi:CRISPR-associated protein Cas1
MSDPEPESFLPVRMLNEFTYCPRLFHLEHVDGLFMESADTVEGTSVHRRLDAKEDVLPAEDGDEAPRVSRSVTLASERLGLVAKVDVAETEGDEAVPVDTKKGSSPDIPEGAWEPERVQICAQGLLLRDAGYRCDHGFLYFAASRRRVRIEFDEPLVNRTLALAEEARLASHATSPPPPLEDSPKCPRCSLAGICLPDEVNALRERDAGKPVRRLVPARDDRIPVYVQGNGLQVGKSGGRIVVRERGRKVDEVLIKDVGQLSIFGSNQVTTQAVKALCDAEVAISWFSYGGWFYGLTRGMGTKNVHLRLAQFRGAEDPAKRLALARRFVAGKIANCRTLLMRNHANPPRQVVDGLRDHAALAERAEGPEALLGIEGNAARLYFGQFAGMLKTMSLDKEPLFEFTKRNRRPPLDPVNSMLSLGYAVLCGDVTNALHRVGFDPFVGFFHAIRPGRPAFALDLMEEFRPLIVDSTVLTVVNNGEATPSGFVTGKAGCMMKPSMRKAFLAAYERRMDTLVTHPVFDYRMSYRRILDVQARLVGASLVGDFDEYSPFCTR